MCFFEEKRGQVDCSSFSFCSACRDFAQVQPHGDQHVPLNDLGTSRTRQGPNVSSTDWPWGKLIGFVTYFG